jgi:hypothetical protein
MEEHCAFCWLKVVTWLLTVHRMKIINLIKFW